MTTRLPADERKRQIANAAIRVFSRHGYRGATTKAIAREAGVAESLLYRHFGSKEELFIAAVERTARRLVEGARELVAAHEDDPARAISAILGFTRGLLERHEPLAKMIFIVSSELDEPAIRRAYLPFQEQALRVIQEAVVDWQRRGLIAGTLPPRAAAWLVLGTFQVVALMRISGRLHELDEVDDAAIVQRMVSSI